MKGWAGLVGNIDRLIDWLRACVLQNVAGNSNMVDGTDKHAGMDGNRRKQAAGKKGKKDDLDNLKKEVEMVSLM